MESYFIPFTLKKNISTQLVNFSDDFACLDLIESNW